jgi:hypothetical protein
MTAPDIPHYQPVSPLAFRKSHLQRIGVRSVEDLNRLVEPYIAQRVDMTALTISNISGGSELLGGLKGEYAELMAEVMEEGRSLEELWSVELVSDVALSEDAKVDAFLNTGAGSPRVRVSKGLCLALDDALLSSLCVLGFFTARLQADDLPEVYPIGACGAENHDRYFDYSRTNVSSSDDLPGALTSHIPLDPVRLAQVDLLLSFAMQWVFLHEQAHWLLGHVEWLRDEGGWANTQLDEALFLDSDRGPDSDDRYCLELQADAFATELMFASGLSDDIVKSQWISRYREALVAYGGHRLSFAADLGDREDRFHMLLLASSISCLLFELRREKRRGGSGSHPPPASRLLNIFMSALETWGDVEEFEKASEQSFGGGYLLDHLRPAISVATRAFVELEMVARVIGLENSLYRSTMLMRDGTAPPARKDLSPLSDDFFRLIKGDRKLTEFATDGGRTFVALLDRSAALYQKLKPYSRNIAFR